MQHVYVFMHVNEQVSSSCVRSSVSATTTKPPPREFEATAKRHCLRPPFHLLSLTQSDDSGEPPLTIPASHHRSLSLETKSCRSEVVWNNRKQLLKSIDKNE
ncbi:hypothetical protein P8452_74772 [Trifolium repens]|nr:hypothetical protein P8452_74772 [Trifolium repens]